THTYTHKQKAAQHHTHTCSHVLQLTCSSLFRVLGTAAGVVAIWRANVVLLSMAESDSMTASNACITVHRVLLCVPACSLGPRGELRICSIERVPGRCIPQSNLQNGR
uniref:Uncharacterized protein n=1 Tax=Anopheles dirus TaxID=7168 RepID=A0A182NW73_9DIPT